MSKFKEELGDARDELEAAKEASKERERALKAKVRDATAERDKLIGVDVSRLCANKLIRRRNWRV